MSPTLTISPVNMRPGVWAQKFIAILVSVLGSVDWILPSYRTANPCHAFITWEQVKNLRLEEGQSIAESGLLPMASCRRSDSECRQESSWEKFSRSDWETLRSDTTVGNILNKRSIPPLRN